MKKNTCIILLIVIFLLSSVFFVPHEKIYKVKDVLSPVNIILNRGEFILKDFDCFDSNFTDKNKSFADKLNITEEEAFITGNLGKNWASNLLKGRMVYVKGEDLVYLKYSYKEKFLYSGFCLKDLKPFYKEGFENILNEIRRTEYKVIDVDTKNVYDTSNPAVKNLKNFIVVKKIHLPKKFQKSVQAERPKIYNKEIISGGIKIYFTDLTKKIKPDRNCEISMCREILNNINNSKESIDMAIYGYSRVPEIENALKSAIKRGVKIRLVYDSNQNGSNIYPDTEVITSIIPNNRSDINSDEVKNIMHNKFYIFDKKILITGSANLSHTDMSGFNSNSMIVINSPEIAKVYTKEFELMYGGKFHNSKPVISNKTFNLSGTEVFVFFSPRDKIITNEILPLINGAEKYIYIPTFLLTNKKTAEALIKAKARGVDVKIIIDALNASVQHTKHKELRAGGVLVKTENYAGKMHSKSMIIDDKYTLIGSMNFSYSGENKNDENLIVIKNSEITKQYKDFFLYQWSRIDDKWLKLNARAEGKDSIGSCTDGLDNNYDGLIDTDDPACRS